MSENELDYRSQMRKKEFEAVISEATDIFQRVLREKKCLQDRLAEYDKDAEIQELNEEINDLQRDALYIFSNVERERNYEFTLRHFKSCKTNRFIYDLIGTEIGTIIKVSCPVCGKTEGITDIDSW